LYSNFSLRKTSVITQPLYSPDLAPSDLAVPYSEKGPPGDMFRNHRGHQIKYNGRTPEDSKRCCLLVLPNNGKIDRASVCAQASSFEGD
jgi:hypothetical protein